MVHGEKTGERASSGHVDVESAARAPAAEDIDEVAQLCLLALVDLLHRLYIGRGSAERDRNGLDPSERTFHSSTSCSTPISSLVKSANTSLRARQHGQPFAQCRAMKKGRT